MKQDITVIDAQLWSLQEQIYYGVSWILFLFALYYLFRIAK